MTSTNNLNHSASISRLPTETPTLQKHKNTKKTNPGPATYDIERYDRFIQQLRLKPSKHVIPSIDRLNITKRLYHPEWESIKMGTNTSETVAPGSYRPVKLKKHKPVTF
jgi:hypothetical protein